MSSFFRFQDIAINAIGQALAGLEVYVCTQPLTSAAGVIPPAPLATLYAASSSNAATITDAEYEGGYIIFTFSATPPADVVVGSFIGVTGANPSGFNAVWEVIEISGNEVTVVTPFENFAPNPGTWVSGGTVATSALPNPVVVDANGNYFFYATNAIYTLVFYDPLNRVPTQVFPDIQVNAPGGGSVSGITVTVPAGLAVSPATITSAGTFAIVYSNDWNANFFLAGPASGSASTPTRRAIVAADLAGVSGLGTVSSVAVTFSGTSGIFVVGVSGSPIDSSGTIALTIAFANQAANTFLAGPASGSTGPISARALVAADLPLPTISALGGVQATTTVAHQFLTGISTSGVPSQAQPAFTDISGNIAPSQEPGLLPVAFSATPVFNAAASNSFSITLTGDVSSSTVTNPTAGQRIVLIITQDATGSRAFTFPANFKGATTIDSSANSVSVQDFIYDGTSWRAISIGSQTSS